MANGINFTRFINFKNNFIEIKPNINEAINPTI